MSNDIRTKAIVLRRTNYGEADRVLTLLTEQGIYSAMAKGVRKEKSKMAGAVELFTVSDVTLHQSRNNKLYIMTSAKMLEHYDQIVYKLSELELAAMIMKQVGKYAENSTGPEYFNFLREIFSALNAGVNPELIETWFWFNLSRINGEQINLVTDVEGEDLDSFKTYVWDSTEGALREQLGGNVAAEDIKLMRLMLSNSLKTTSRVKDIATHLPTLLYISKIIAKQ